MRKILCGLEGATVESIRELGRAGLDWRAVKAHLGDMTDAQSINALEAHPNSQIASGVGSYAASLALIAISTGIGLWIAPRWGTGPVDMLYLPAVLAAAALWGLGRGLVAASGAALAYNFFFTEPVHTFRVNRVDDVVTVVVLLFVAIVDQPPRRRNPKPGAARRCARRAECNHCGVRRPPFVVQQRRGNRSQCMHRIAPAFPLQCAAGQRCIRSTSDRCCAAGQ